MKATLGDGVGVLTVGMESESTVGDGLLESGGMGTDCWSLAVWGRIIEV